MTQNESCFNIFYFDWTNEVNLLVPPVHFLPKTIKRLDSNARSKAKLFLMALSILLGSISQKSKQLFYLH